MCKCCTLLGGSGLGPFILLELEPIVYLEKIILREKKRKETAQGGSLKCESTRWTFYLKVRISDIRYHGSIKLTVRRAQSFLPGVKITSQSRNIRPKSRKSAKTVQPVSYPEAGFSRLPYLRHERGKLLLNFDWLNTTTTVKLIGVFKNSAGLSVITLIQ